MANPQIHDTSNPEELQALNAKWVNGIAPGYAPLAGAGLVLNIGAGAAFSGSAIIDYAGGTLALADNSTNYVFLDSTSSYAPGSNTTGFTSTLIPIATVVTASGAISSVTDNRLSPKIGGGGGGTPGGTNHEVQINSSGSFGGLATGTAGQYLRSGGATADPAFASIAESEVANLVSDLAAKAPLASPALTGTPTAPTASPGTSTTQLATTAFVQGAIPVSSLVIGFVINNGAAGTNVGAMLQAPRAGTVSKCVIVTKASDGTTGLTFRIKQNGVDVFTSDPSVAAGTTSGTTSSSTSLTSSPLTVAAGDVFSIDITSGSPNWAFTAQLET